MATEMTQYRGTSAEWTAANPILGEGEMGYAIDTKILKIGDGVSAWSFLPVQPYIPSGVLTQAGELLTASGPLTAAAVAPGSHGNGDRLTVQADGTLAWAIPTPITSLELIGHAASTYATISEEASADALLESTAHAASTYITVATAVNQHATYDTLDHMAATYVAKAYATANYEPKWTYKVKAGNTTRISTTTLAADPDLVFPVVAGGVYVFTMGLFLDDISTTADYQFGVTPGLASAWHAGLHGAPTSAATTDSTINHRMMGSGANELSSVNVAGLGAFFYVSMKGHCAITTSGNFGLTWAQFTSQPSPGTILYKGSFLRALRIS